MATKPTHNLIRDGIDKCADYILATVRRKKVKCNVYVDRTGDVRIRTVANYRPDDVRNRPDFELVCVYRAATACLEYIREDLEDRLERMPKFLRQEAA